MEKVSPAEKVLEERLNLHWNTFQDLNYFQTDIIIEGERLDGRDPEQVCNSREWLTKKSPKYAGFFCDVSDVNDQTADCNSTSQLLQPRSLRSYSDR